jgi:hypothetical protein
MQGPQQAGHIYMAGWDGLCVSNEKQQADSTVRLYNVRPRFVHCTAATVQLYLRFASGMLCQVLLHMCSRTMGELSDPLFLRGSPKRSSTVGGFR